MQKFGENPLVPIKSAPPGQIEKYLIDIDKESTAKLGSMNQAGRKLQLLIVILPDQSGSYGQLADWTLETNIESLPNYLLTFSLSLQG